MQLNEIKPRLKIFMIVVDNAKSFSIVSSEYSEN